MKGKIVVLSAPSGAGKTTICREIIKRHPEAKLSVSATTRPRRPHETDGVDYYFLTEEEFMEKVKKGEFIEFEKVHGNWYGTLKSELKKAEDPNSILLFDIDVNGALNIRRLEPNAILIFIMPPSKEDLIKRLKNRKTEDEETIRKRLDRLPYEFEQSKKFDYIVVNDTLDHAVHEVEKIIGLANE
jgi:guanylate kinase